MKIITKKKLKQECWNLDFELIKWLNEHLKIYKEDASKIVDLEYKKYKYKKVKYTQLDIINRLIDLTDYLLMNYYVGSIEETESMIKAKDEMYDLLKLVHWDLWW